MALSFIYLTLGLVLSNLAHFASRNRESRQSPIKPDSWFFLTDNWIKILHSVVIGVLLNIACNINVAQTSKLLGITWEPIFSIGIGFFPDTILGLLKSKLRWLQPKRATDSEGTTYNRK